MLTFGLDDCGEVLRRIRLQKLNRDQIQQLYKYAGWEIFKESLVTPFRASVWILIPSLYHVLLIIHYRRESKADADVSNGTYYAA